MELKHEILKDLILRYQQTKDKGIFSRILKRCDGLLIAIINRNLWRKGLENYNARELYHAAIIGLHRAVMTSPIDEHPDKVVARIVAYVKLELSNQFEREQPSETLQDPTLIHLRSKREDIQDPAYIQCEFSLVMELLKKAVKEGILTEKELEAYLQRKMYEVGYYQIGQMLNLSRDAARKRLLVIEERLQKWLTDKI